MQIYSSKIFENPIDIIEASGDLREAFRKIEYYRGKYYLLGFINYDFNYLYFEVFEGFRPYTASSPKKLGTILKNRISKEKYLSDIEQIKKYIKKGITYEVNYTYPIDVKTNLDGLELYESILDKQRTPYNAFMQTPQFNILSFSPELFFKLKGRKITTKPMKGTAPKGENAEENRQQKEFLYNDIKNRAENIMIVDLLRNDLGRISKTGSVNVSKLFEIEEYPTVFQMISEIESELEENIVLYDIFKAIFPCGSITGAPKVSTMRIIKELEPYNRNVYCGAIGLISPDECEFSVPIRILYGKDYNYTYHAGGAIVWDSDSEDEWEETIIKSKIINADFSLIETAVDSWEKHVSRMKKSAEELGFIWNPEIDDLQIPPGKILRAELFKNGDYEVQIKEIDKITSNKIKIEGTVNSKNPFLYHKTSLRTTKPKDCFDIIRTNERGEITEGIFTNIMIEKDGARYTPPVSSGLLNGTYRQELNILEKVLYPKDLEEADRIFCYNSVRKLVEVELC